MSISAHPRGHPDARVPPGPLCRSAAGQCRELPEVARRCPPPAPNSPYSKPVLCAKRTLCPRPVLCFKPLLCAKSAPCSKTGPTPHRGPCARPASYPYAKSISPRQKQNRRPDLKIQPSVHMAKDVGVYLSSRAVASQVFSAQVSLTAVFGMGTGVPSPPLAPTERVCGKSTCVIAGPYTLRTE